MKRTDIEREANRIDLSLFNLELAIDRLASDVGGSDAIDLYGGSRLLIETRSYVRKHMHADDRRDTTLSATKP